MSICKGNSRGMVEHASSREFTIYILWFMQTKPKGKNRKTYVYALSLYYFLGAISEAI